MLWYETEGVCLDRDPLVQTTEVVFINGHPAVNVFRYVKYLLNETLLIMMFVNTVIEISNAWDVKILL